MSFIDWLLRLFKPRPAQPPATPDDWKNEMLRRINDLRSVPLSIDARCSDAAQRHSEWMADRDIVNHNGGPARRLKAAGYEMVACAENIAFGRCDVISVVAAWEGSPGHNQNMRNTLYSDCGFGRATSRGRIYWTAVFAKEFDAI